MLAVALYPSWINHDKPGSRNFSSLVASHLEHGTFALLRTSKNHHRRPPPRARLCNLLPSLHRSRKAAHHLLAGWASLLLSFAITSACTSACRSRTCIHLRASHRRSRVRSLTPNCAVDASPQTLQARLTAQASTTSGIRVFARRLELKLPSLADWTDRAGRARSRRPSSLQPGSHKVANSGTTGARSKVLAPLISSRWFGKKLLNRRWVSRLTNWVLARTTASWSEHAGHGSGWDAGRSWHSAAWCGLDIIGKHGRNDISQARSLLMSITLTEAESIG